MIGDNSISKEDGLSALKLVFHALISSGMTIDEIVDQTNSILQELIESDEITLLFNKQLGLAKDKRISKLGGIVFDSDRRTIFYKGQKVDLSPNETKLMRHFLSKPGKLITHKEIVELLYSNEENLDEPVKICRPLISRLRKRLSHFPDGKNWIDTVRGNGYVFSLNI